MTATKKKVATQQQTEARHTSGPWFWTDDTPGGAPCVSVPRGLVQVLMWQDVPESEAVANARLIAAAPQLLAALEEGLRWADESHSSPCPVCGVAPSKCGCWIGQARAAIAAARGGK